MQQPPQLPLWPPGGGAPGSSFLDALPYLGGALIVGVLGFFGVRFTATAPLQQALNDAFRAMTAELQSERAQLTARISELEEDKAILQAEIARQRQEIRGLLQWQDSARRWFERSGTPLPPTLSESSR